jgi:hypothetical protein
VHPLLRGFLLAKLAELEGAELRPLVAHVVGFLVAQKLWDECLFVLELFPQEALVLSALGSGLAEMLDSGRIATVSHWLELAKRQRLTDPLLLLAEAEIALRQREDRRAQALGEHAGSLLKGDLAARAYLAAARGAHLRDDVTSALALCERSISSGISTATQFDALWLEFGCTFERGSPDAPAILERLQSFKDLDAARHLRLLTSKAMVVSETGEIVESIKHLELAVALTAQVDDPFARTNLLHHLSYVRLLCAKYSESIIASSRLIADGHETGLQFAIDNGLLRQAGAHTGMRKLGHTQRALDELRRRSGSASQFILDNMVIQRARLAIASGDLSRAVNLLDLRFTEASRPPFVGRSVAIERSP